MENNVQQSPVNQKVRDLRRTTAALLAFFLGGIGVHKFYLGQAGRGLLYFLFCWTGIPALIGFVEAIILFSMNDNTFDQKYCMK